MFETKQVWFNNWIFENLNTGSDMKKAFYIVFVLFLFISKSYPQEGFYCRFELGPTGDIFQFTDNGSQLGFKPVMYASWGVAVGKEFTPLFTLETGFYSNYFAESFYFKRLKETTSINGIYDTWQIPLRLKSGVHIFRDVLVFGTTVGVNYCIRYNKEKNSTGIGKIAAPQDTVDYSYSSKDFGINNYFLLETGLFLDLKLFKGFHLCLTGSYFNGFKKIYENQITYIINHGTPSCGAIATNGDYYSIMCGLKYVIQPKKEVRKVKGTKFHFKKKP